MFTGLIEEVGEVLALKKGVKSAEITIKGKKILEKIKLGDSIAVNGVCLTVVSFNKESFIVEVMAETLRKSNLGNLNKGSKVNLERALALGDRLGGHIVSGHIDGIGEIVGREEEDIATWIKIKVDYEFMRYIVYKGSIAIDGISLTVAEEGKDYFKVSLIPHTKEETTLINKAIGEKVNLEGDVIAKYVEKLTLFKGYEKKENKITEDFLRENGFM